MTKDEPSIENSQVTTAFLVQELGMVAAEEYNVGICQCRVNMKGTNTGKALHPSEMQSRGDEIIKVLNDDNLSPPLTYSPEALNKPRPESLESIISSPEEKVRSSMDSDNSKETSQASSSVSNVDTNASTPPSAHGKKHSPVEIVGDVVPTRFFYDRRNRLEGPIVAFAAVPENCPPSNAQHSKDYSDEVQGGESTDAVGVEPSGSTMLSGEGKTLDVEKPLTILEANVSDSSKIGAMLESAEVRESHQVSKKAHGGRKLRSTRKGVKIATDHRKSVQRRINAAAADVREDVEDEINTLQKVISKLQRHNKALASREIGMYNEWQQQRLRTADDRYDRENEDPDTVAEANNLTKKLQEKYQLLEETSKQQIMALRREYDNYMQSHQGGVDAVRSQLHKAQEETTYAEQSKNDYKQQLDDALSHQILHLTDQQIILAFQNKEEALIQEKENVSQLLEGETKKLQKAEVLIGELRVDCREAERQLEDAQDKITQLISANVLLEARAEPIDFLGLPSGQRNEMAQKDLKLEEMADELQCAKETITKMANANGDKAMAILLDSNAHKISMLTTVIETNNDEILELQNKQLDREYTQERDWSYAARMEEDMEELQIQYNAASKDLRELREQLANGNHTLADPKSWLHMKECSEGREQAILLQEKAEKRLEGWEQLQEDYQDHVCKLWRRICGFEELRAPSNCPAYLTDDRHELVARTLELLNVNVDDANVAETLEEEKQKFGCYRGPHGTPANWLHHAQNQAAAGNSAQASTSGSASSQVAQGSASGGPVTGVVGDAGIEPEWTMSPAVQAHLDELTHLSDEREELIVCLWGHIWEFEDIVTPKECDERVWDNRLDLVKQTEELTQLVVNAIDPESEALLTGPHGPLHTPAHWMPAIDHEIEEVEDDKTADVENGGNGDALTNGFPTNDMQNHLGNTNDHEATSTSINSSPHDDSKAKETFFKALQSLQPTKAPNPPAQNNSSPLTTTPSIIVTYHDPPSNPPTVASSSTTPLAELDLRAKLLADNYADPQQVINDHLLAQYLADHPELLDGDQTPSEEPWISRHGYLNIDTSAKKNKSKQKSASGSCFSEEGFWQNHVGLADVDLDAMIADFEVAAGGEGAREHGQTVRWADEVAAGLVGIDVGSEQAKYSRASDTCAELEVKKPRRNLTPKSQKKKQKKKKSR